MDRIVITGATGFLGSHLTRLFLEQGMEVFALVRPESLHINALPEHERLHLVRCGLEQVADCVDIIGQADGFFHFAWGGVNREEIDSPQVQAKNVSGSLECVEAARRLGCRIFMDAGSRVEYGVTEDGRMQEEMECHPVNAYGKAKLEFYKKAALLCPSFGIRYYHLRFFSVYGYGDHPWSIISTLVRDLPAGKTVALSACLHRWNFMYIDDAVEAVYRLYLAGKREKSTREGLPVNIASEDTRVLRDFVEEIKELSGGRGQLQYGTFVQAKEGALSICPAVDRLHELTGGEFKERYTFRQGIHEMMKKGVEQ